MQRNGGIGELADRAAWRGQSWLLTRLAEALGLELCHYKASLLSYDALVGYPLPDQRGGRRTVGKSGVASTVPAGYHPDGLKDAGDERCRNHLRHSQEFPPAKTIVLSTYQDDEDIYGAIEAGAVTYPLKDMLGDSMIEVIRGWRRAGGRSLRKSHSG